MPLVLIAALLLSQIPPAQVAELRRYRYGRTAAQIEAMGFDAYRDLFDKRTPNADAGFMRGVAYGVFVDAYRENTAQRYRKALPLREQSRLLALDKQMRFIGVLFARNTWLSSGGGNAFDPEGDTLDHAEAERRLYVKSMGRPGGMRSKEAPLIFGSIGSGTKEIRANLAKVSRAVAKAKTLCRTPHERAILRDFVGEQTKAWAKTLTEVR